MDTGMRVKEGGVNVCVSKVASAASSTRGGAELDVCVSIGSMVAELGVCTLIESMSTSNFFDATLVVCAV